MRSATATSGCDDLTAIILVGGHSSRMGRPKPWLDVAGRSLLARVVERVLPSASHIVLVAAPGQVLPPLDDAHTGNTSPASIVRVHDDHPGEGPLPALALGLATTATPWAIALGCDSLLVRPSIIGRLGAERCDAVDAVIPQWDGRPQPLVALYRRTLAPVLGALVVEGERRLHVITTLPGVRLIPPEALHTLDPAGDSFRCVNTPNEYAAAVTTWAAENAASRRP